MSQAVVLLDTANGMSEAETAVQAGDEQRAYEILVEAGKRAREQHDNSNWDLGDVADKVDIAWGEERLQQWASDVSISYPKAREVRRVARAWGEESRRWFRERYPALSWSHFQAAAGHRDEAGNSDAVFWLTQAGANGWSTPEFREQLRQTPIAPEELWELKDFEATVGPLLDDTAAARAYLGALLERLTDQHRRRGVSSVVNPTRDVMAEIAEEALDIGAWAWIRRMQAQYNEQDCDEGQLGDLIRLGCAAWRRCGSVGDDG